MILSLRNASTALIVFGALVVVGCGGSEKSTTSTSATSSTTTSQSSTTTDPGTSSTTTGASSPTSSTVASSEQPETAVWPFAADTTRYTDPIEVAKSFAITYLGFVDPVIGPFQQGDTSSGEVSVGASDAGPTTTIFLRQLTSEQTWWVLGADTPALQVTSPEALATITSPVTIAGQSTAFEGTINIEIREDGRLSPLADGIATGGANGEMGPFSTSLRLAEGGAPGGAVVVKSLSAKDGSTTEATVTRVQFS